MEEEKREFSKGDYVQINPDITIEELVYFSSDDSGDISHDHIGKVHNTSDNKDTISVLFEGKGHTIHFISSELIFVDGTSVEKRRASVDKVFSEINVFQTLGEKLEEMFPNNWELQSKIHNRSFYNELRCTIYIRFPELEIVNSENRRHKIYDLYVLFKFKYENKFDEDNNLIIDDKLIKSTGEFYGTRGKLMYKEYNSNYRHSHLTSSSFQFSNFCTGSGPIHSDIIALQDEFDEDIFIGMLFNLDAYVRWESLEGGPYIKMENIVSERVNKNLSLSEKNKNLIAFIKEYDNVPIKYNPVTNRYFINEYDTIFVTMLDKVSSRKQNYQKPDEITDNRSLGFTFKNEDIYLKLIPDEQIQTEGEHTDDRIIKYVAHELTSAINTSSFEENYRNSYSCNI